MNYSEFNYIHHKLSSPTFHSIEFLFHSWTTWSLCLGLPGPRRGIRALLYLPGRWDPNVSGKLQDMGTFQEIKQTLSWQKQRRSLYNWSWCVKVNNYGNGATSGRDNKISHRAQQNKLCSRMHQPILGAPKPTVHLSSWIKSKPWVSG